MFTWLLVSANNPLKGGIESPFTHFPLIQSPRKGVCADEMMIEEEGVEHVDAAIQTDDAYPTLEDIAEEPESSTPEEESRPE